MKSKRLIIICSILFTALIILTISCSNPVQSKYTLNEELYGNPYGKDYRGHVGDGKYQIFHVGYNSLLIMEGENWGTKRAVDS